MPAIALLVKVSLSWLIKVVTTPRDIEYRAFPGRNDIARQESNMTPRY